MTNRIGTTPHPTSGDIYAVEVEGLENSDGIMILRAAGPLEQDAPRDGASLTAMLDHAGTEGCDRTDGQWLQDNWGALPVPFRATTIILTARTKLGWACSTQPAGTGPYDIIPAEKPRFLGSAKTIMQKVQQDPMLRSLQGVIRIETWFHMGRPLRNTWWPHRLEELLQESDQITAHYANQPAGNRKR